MFQQHGKRETDLYWLNSIDTLAARATTSESMALEYTLAE